MTRQPHRGLRSEGTVLIVGMVLLRFIVWAQKSAALVIAATAPCQATEPALPMSSAPVQPFANRLAREKSPYLLQHQNNPVDWYPWGEEAFEKARKENKPIFLSIGYSTCHWCHVMAHECFENPEIAKRMNAHFINIKVDREERPDVDRVYMTYIQATTGRGGWPMSVFLTPDLKPFMGGTYFPPSDKQGRPGFPTLLQRLAEGWAKDRNNILAHSQTVTEQLRQFSEATTPQEKLATEEALTHCLDGLAQDFDADLGGFGNAPKFPRPAALNFLLRRTARREPKKGAEPAAGDYKAARGMSLWTLQKMAMGGIHDHLGGGFHRYSVDKFWHVPHFEKMLYDQAQLACTYLDAYQVSHASAFAETARAILDYVRRDLTDPEGGFYSAQDADSLLAHGKPEHAEGAFYVWTAAEIDAALGGDTDQSALFKRVYGVESSGNAPQGSDPQGELAGKNVLIQRLSIKEAAQIFGKTPEQTELSLAESRRALFAAREGRPKPHLDDKIITAWNGLMISAFARASQVLGVGDYRDAAQRSARFIRKNLWKNGVLLRSYRQGAGGVAGFPDDYAALIQGLLDLYEADFDVSWLEWALELQEKQDALFADGDRGGYFSTAADSPGILFRIKEDYDGAEPSPNSLSALNLLRLSQITGNEAFREKAQQTLRAFGDQMAKIPTALPQLLCAADAFEVKPLQIVIAGHRDEAQTRALLEEVHAHFLPNKVLLLADGGIGQEWLGRKLEFIRAAKPQGDKSTAFVCENFVCQLPVTERAELRALLAR